MDPRDVTKIVDSIKDNTRALNKLNTTIERIGKKNNQPPKPIVLETPEHDTIK